MPNRPKTFVAVNLDGRLVRYRRGRGPGRSIERQVQKNSAWAAVNEHSSLGNYSASELKAIAAAWEAEF